MELISLLRLLLGGFLFCVVSYFLRLLLLRATVGSTAQQQAEAETLGLTLVQDGTRSTLTGQLRGRPVRAVRSWVSSGQTLHPQTVLVVPIHEPLPTGLSLSAEHASALGRALSGQDIQLGDPELDAVLRIACANPAAALRLLRVPGVAQEAADFFRHNRTAELNEQRLRLSIPAHPETSWLSVNLSDMTHLAEVLESALRGEPLPLDPELDARRRNRQHIVSQYHRQLRGWKIFCALGVLSGVPMFGVGFRDLAMAPLGIPAVAWSAAGMVLVLAGMVSVWMGPKCPACGAPPGRTEGLGGRSILFPDTCLQCGHPLV